MKSKLNRVAVVLCAFILLFSTTGCANTTDATPTPTAQVTDTPSGTPTPTAQVTDTPSGTPTPSATPLPYHDLQGNYYYDTQEKNYGNEEFRIYVNDNSNEVWYDTDFTAVEDDGDNVGRAIFNRNSLVEEQLGVRIVTIPLGNFLGVDTELRKLIANNEDAFDVVMTNARSAATLSQEGLFTDILDMDIEYQAPWWDHNANEQLAICNRLYMTTGDIGLMAKKSFAVSFSRRNWRKNSNSETFMRSPMKANGQPRK